MTSSPGGAPTLDVLLPVARAGERIGPSASEGSLRALYAHPEPSVGSPTYVRANMVTTLDGAATGPDRLSGSINGAADHRVFGVLRSVADVVLVGAGTVRAEGYAEVDLPAALRTARAADGGRRLELAVVCGTGALPTHLLRSTHPPYLLVAPGRPGLDQLRAQVGAERVLVVGTGQINGAAQVDSTAQVDNTAQVDSTAQVVDLTAALATLAALGLTKVLAEGGPRLLGRLLGLRLVDELCLTTTPVVVGGSAPRVVDGAPWLGPAAGSPAHLLHAGGVLLGRWLLDRSSPG